MKKQKLSLNLKLNKQVVSKLNENKILGGNQIMAAISEDPTCPYSDWICFKTHDCTQGGPSICGG